MLTQYAVHVIEPRTSRDEPPFLENSSHASRSSSCGEARQGSVLQR